MGARCGRGEGRGRKRFDGGEDVWDVSVEGIGFTVAGHKRDTLASISSQVLQSRITRTDPRPWSPHPSL